MVDVKVWVNVLVGPVSAVPLPIATDPLVNEPAPVMTAVTFEDAALFKVTAPVIVKESLMERVAPEAEKVNEAALEAALRVAVPAVFDTVSEPVVENPSMLCVPVPLIVMAELPAVNVPLLIKLPPSVSAKLLAEVLSVAPLLMVSGTLVLNTLAASKVIVPVLAMMTPPVAANVASHSLVDTVLAVEVLYCNVAEEP